MESFYPGIKIKPTLNPMGFKYGEDCFGPQVENRHLDAIRKSLKEPECQGPDIVYSIAMDVGKYKHISVLEEKMLLFGVVTYAQGRLGREPIRSQGHIHRVSSHSNWSPPEVYEIWSGKAVIYMQETAKDNPGRCFAVYTKPGDVVIVPPYWAHATISADPEEPLTFGAWCDREYGFEYDEVRAHKGLAWYPLLKDNNELSWQANDKYSKNELIIKKPNDYSFLGIKKNVPIYTQFEENPELFQFVSKPELKEKEWIGFTP
jgi:glucose-6-phosphate isomerase, archaeal